MFKVGDLVEYEPNNGRYAPTGRVRKGFESFGVCCVANVVETGNNTYLYLDKGHLVVYADCWRLVEDPTNPDPLKELFVDA